jgi:hypothetical protein
MDVQDKIQDLENRILTATALRDAQRSGTTYHEHFQDKVTRLTQEMLAWQEKAPRLQDLAHEIRFAKADVVNAERARDYTDAGGAAKVLGVFGGLLLVIVLLWPSPPALLTVVCILCLLGAGGCVLLAARTHRTRDQVVIEAETNLKLLESKWRSLTPDGKSWAETTKAPVAVGAGQGAFEDDFEDGD